MKKLIAKLLTSLCMAAGLVSGANAAGVGIEWDKFPKDKMTDMAALQNGAKLFVNYCLNCHSASYMRYNRMRDLGLTEAQIKSNLMFATDKVGGLMTVSLDPKQAKDWFGALPPDLTRVRVQTICTPICVPSTGMTARPLAGTIWLSRRWRCPMCCGNCKVSAGPNSVNRPTRMNMARPSMYFKDSNS